jgi:hypothetical protein
MKLIPTAFLRVLVLSGGLAVCAGVPPEATASENDVTHDFLYPVEELTTQETRPYKLDSGSILTRDLGAWRVYGRSVRRYPSAVKCLEKGAIRDGQADLLRIDWEDLGITDRSVCLFRIMTTINDPEATDAWLRAHGFTISELNQNLPKSDVLWITGSWTIEQFRENFPLGILARIHGVDPVRTVTALVKFDKDGLVRLTGFSAN